MNETETPFKLIVYVTDTLLTREWRSTIQATRTYEIYEKEHCFTRELWGGYVRHNTIFRKVYNPDGNEMDDEFITENHAITIYEPFLTYEGETT